MVKKRKTPKKKIKKRAPKKKVREVATSKKEKHPHDVRIEQVLVQNFVSLQKVIVNLSIKFDNLSSQLTKLLNIFEISAKALAKKNFEIEKKDVGESKKILEKLEGLTDQNKTIAKGLTLIHEKHEPEPFRDFEEFPQTKEELPAPPSKPIVPKTKPVAPGGILGGKKYQKSISAGVDPFPKF